MELVLIKPKMDIIKGLLKNEYPAIKDRRPPSSEENRISDYVLDYYVTNVGVIMHPYTTTTTNPPTYTSFSVTVYYYKEDGERVSENFSFGTYETPSNIFTELKSMIGSRLNKKAARTSDYPTQSFRFKELNTQMIYPSDMCHSSTFSPDPWTPISKLVDILDTLVQTPVRRPM